MSYVKKVLDYSGCASNAGSLLRSRAVCTRCA